MSDFKLRLAARCILQGGIVAYPTEAVYGLGCDPLNAGAVLRLLALKQRSVDKGVILIAADYSQIEPFIMPLTASQRQLLNNTWPGPVTWLLPAQTSVPQWITGKHERIAIRITAHPLAKALCETVGQAIVSTSCNISQQPPAKTPLTIRRYFHNTLDYILTGPLGGLDKPTIIKDLITGSTVR
ncbi:L-threonylcarbamoyladenylate synthase [Kaarinaea lacus]